MSSPFSWFRRKQKVLLAVFGVLIMISFTVGGIISNSLQRRMGGGGGKAPVVNWKHGEINENELSTMRYNHSLSVRFLDRVVAETRAKEGWPRAPGVTRDRMGQIIDPGIPRSSQEEDVVRTMLMAQRAIDMGMVVTDESIFEFLKLLSDDKLRRPDFGRILADVDQSVSQTQLFKQLRIELLAQNLERVIRSGLMAMPPDRVWDYFNRSNRAITAEVFPVRVADFKSKVEDARTDNGVDTGAGTGSHTVTTTVNCGSNPLESAPVRYTKGEKSYVQFTDEDGQCTHNLDDGTWTLDITMFGYSPTETTLAVNGNESPEYSVALLPEVEELFEEAKDDYPNPDPNSPEPGFKRRKKIAFQYLRVDYNKFLEREKEAVSMEEVKKHYEKRKNDFIAPELPPAEDEKPEAKPAEEGDVDIETDAKEKKDAGEDPATEPAEEGGAKPDATDEMETEKPEVTPAKDDAAGREEPTPDTTGKTAAKKKAETPPKDEPPTETAKPKKEAPETPAKDDTSAPAVDLVPPKNKSADFGTSESPDDARVWGHEDTLFVSFGAESDAKDAEDATATETNASEETPAKPDSKDAEGTTTAKPDIEKPADQPGDNAAEKPDPKGEPTSEDTPPADPKKKAVEGDATAAEARDKPAADAETTEEEKPVKYQPLEDVEDQIRGEIAKKIAQTKRDEAFVEVEKKALAYFEDRNVWESMVRNNLEAKEPTPLDHEALADEWKLTAGETPMVDAIEITDFELGKSYVFQQEQILTFPQIAYTEDMPLFRPYRIPSSELDVEFLFWKIEEEDWKGEEGEDESVPELDDDGVRDEVIDAWQRIKALDLAKAEAEKLAKEAKDGESLAKSLGLDEEEAEEVTPTGEFSWMTGGATPMGMGGMPRISSVSGVESPGADFMEAVFEMKPGEVGVAVNQPKSVVYVVRVISEAKDEAQLKDEFLERGSMYAIYPHMAAVQEAMDNWHEDLKKEMEVEWHRPPVIYATR